VRDDGGIDLAVLRPPAGGFPPHSHDEYVVSVNVRGVEQVRLDRRVFEVGTDEVTVYNPGQVQSCRTTVPDGAAWACVSIYIPAETVESTFGRGVEFERPVVRAPELRSALLAAAGRGHRSGPADPADDRRLPAPRGARRRRCAGGPPLPHPGRNRPDRAGTADRRGRGRDDLHRRPDERPVLVGSGGSGERRAG
jgi:AraC family chemosensory pili system transcriptional regulator ChpD